MRARVEVADFIDPRRGGFGIDAGIGDRIRSARSAASSAPAALALSVRPPR